MPANVRPVHYQITLQPYMDKFTFDGLELIDIDVIEATSEIVLNAVEMRVSAGMVIKDGRWIRASSITQDEEGETVTIAFPETIEPGTAQLDLRFVGELNDKLRGFYRSQYVNPEGEVSYLATTQFEATDARRAFPCWDEPACKATFQLTLNIPANMVPCPTRPSWRRPALDAGFKSIMFHPHADYVHLSNGFFVVGDLSYIEQEAVNNTTVGVWTTRGKRSRAGRPGNLGSNAGVLQRLLRHSLSSGKAGPHRHPRLRRRRHGELGLHNIPGGRRCWWTRKNSSAGTRQRVAEVVAHEMAHMWFGDLVTMEWWDDLWLNESFASWMGTKATDWAFPEWDMWTQFVNMDTNRAPEPGRAEELPPH